MLFHKGFAKLFTRCPTSKTLSAGFGYQAILLKGIYTPRKSFLPSSSPIVSSTCIYQVAGRGMGGVRPECSPRS